MIAEAVKHMLAAGMPHEAIVAAISDMEACVAPKRSSSADRMARKRARDAKASQSVTCDESDVCDAPPIPSPSFPPNPLTNPTPAPVNNNSRARGTRLPADFKLPTDWRDWAVKDRGWTREDAEEEGRAFADFWHAKAGRDAAKVDWPATWRNWARNSRRQHGSRARSRQFSDGLIV